MTGDIVDVAVKGATIVSPAGRRRADLYIDGGCVAAVGGPERPARERVDATGLIVLPGMIDTHVHLMDPGEPTREDFPAGTAAAAANGVTTIIEHTHAAPVRTVDDLARKQGYLAGRSHVDFALAAHLWPEDIPAIPTMWHAGAAYFKIFTCTTHGVPGLDNAQLLEALAAVAAAGAVCLVHCEDERLTAAAGQALRASGDSDGSVVPRWRSPEAELVAVQTVLALAEATGARVGIAHVSAPPIARLIDDARSRGARVAGEACPQYFVLREDEVVTHGPFRKFTPPARLRTDAEEREMWRLLRNGTFHHVSTDHAPSTREQKQAATIWEAPFGLPGLDTTLALLLDACAQGQLALEDVARGYAERPAQWYGLAPRKGALRPGADADFVLVDVAAERTLSDDAVLSKAGWTPYAGRRVRGRVLATYLRGVAVASDGRCEDRRTGRALSGPGWTP